MPLNVFVIEHEDGLVLFDTGADPAVATDPDYWPDSVTRLFMKHIFRFDIRPDDNLATQLDRAGYRAEDVTKAVLSHLHFDHAGGIRDIPQAELLVAAEAWAHMLERDQVPATGTREVLLESYAKVRALKAHTPDLVIVASHDITAAAKLASTPRFAGSAAMDR